MTEICLPVIEKLNCKVKLPLALLKCETARYGLFQTVEKVVLPQAKYKKVGLKRFSTNRK